MRKNAARGVRGVSCANPGFRISFAREVSFKANFSEFKQPFVGCRLKPKCDPTLRRVSLNACRLGLHAFKRDPPIGSVPPHFGQLKQGFYFMGQKWPEMNTQMVDLGNLGGLDQKWFNMDTNIVP